MFIYMRETTCAYIDIDFICHRPTLVKTCCPDMIILQVDVRPRKGYDVQHVQHRRTSLMIYVGEGRHTVESRQLFNIGSANNKHACKWCNIVNCVSYYPLIMNYLWLLGNRDAWSLIDGMIYSWLYVAKVAQLIARISI